MLSYLKIRISLWYTLLLTAILASTLYAIYQIIGYQLKNEILNNLNIKTESISAILNEEENSDEDSDEHHHRERDERTENPTEDLYYKIRLITEMSDDNYVLFVYSNSELKYLTEKYLHAGLDVLPYQIDVNQIKEFVIQETLFCITSIGVSDSTYYLGYEMSALTDLQNKLMQIFIIVFPIGVLLSFGCGFIVTQGSMNIINKINETTNKITSTNLSQRIEIPKGKDEISRLITTLNSMFDRLEKTFAQAKQFSQDAAHELRTPLTIIRGEIEELIEGEASNGKTIQKLEDILEEIQYMSSISERLLLIHTMDTHKIKYHFEVINLSELLKEIHQDATIISSGKNISVTHIIQEQIELNCSKELITRLLWNVVDNAIKYNTPEGMVRINLHKDNSNIFIVVEDNGVGIPQEEIPQIFNRFYRVDKSRSRELGGSGLGLAICKWIVELHNGVISVESEVNKGTKFIIAFPSSYTYNEQ